jgi:hypothetical protein
MAWTLKGTYVESCNCAAACPCIFLSDPTHGECTVLVGWHVEHGKDGDVSLDDRNVALAVHCPGNMVKVKWKAALYCDERADAKQEAALHRIFGGQAGGHPAALASYIGEVVGVRKAPIEFSRRDGTFRLAVSGIAALELEQMSGQGGEPIQISGHPLAIAPGFAVTQATSKSLTYDDHGMSWKLSGRNAFFAPFEYRG